MSENSTQSLEDLYRNFLKTLETRESADEIRVHYHPAATQTEYPNAILQHTEHRDLEEILESSERGHKLLEKETYEVKHLYSVEDTVIAEIFWQGTLAVPIGKLKPGDSMTAHIAQITQFKQGMIWRQRNYDCFDPF